MTNPTSNQRLTRSEQYLGKDRDQLREIILDRDEEIASLSDTLQDARQTNYESEAAKLVVENRNLTHRLIAAEALLRDCRSALENSYWDPHLELSKRIVEHQWVTPSAEETTEHPDPAKRCQHDLLKPGCTVLIAGGVRCTVCLQHYVMPSPEVCGRPTIGHSEGTCTKPKDHKGHCWFPNMWNDM